jgi:hypothetical protein
LGGRPKPAQYRYGINIFYGVAAVASTDDAEDRRSFKAIIDKIVRWLILTAIDLAIAPSQHGVMVDNDHAPRRPSRRFPIAGS